MCAYTIVSRTNRVKPKSISVISIPLLAAVRVNIDKLRRY